MKILSIETSCDDTGITIFEAKGGTTKASFKILSNIVSSQDIHAEFGGVFPMMAKREHIKNLPIVLDISLKKAKLTKSKKPVDAIAVTYGPGLEPCLWSGIVFAKELAEKWDVPIIPVNHMEGHILSVFAKPKGTFNISLTKKQFPMLTLLVSGGHTELVLVKDLGKYEIIGKTLDDAAGEAYDKVARMLGLPYPGGPALSRLAEEKRKELGDLFEHENENRKGFQSMSERRLASATARARGIFQQKNIRAEQGHTLEIFPLPRPMLKSPNFHFSFAGLKTAVLYGLKKIEPLNDAKKKMVAMEFENAVIDTLLYKTMKASDKYGIKSVIIAGGVAANKHLQKQFRQAFGKKNVLLPDNALTGDNALMIGIAGYLRYMQGKKKVPKPASIKANGNLEL
ncbi:MAG TPA: tRNA (adenosine(37)-N6)-threonylcarbamoyltransferase complex transferase subunit TsaD [Candidatus Paceibacterota bacterium]|nr:tRNA (adenosine(37)-N6)-threonylcarbamoyltransferase complex transferase subunit TsaD [Candidatus Paceibacterota bacterium]